MTDGSRMPVRLVVNLTDRPSPAPGRSTAFLVSVGPPRERDTEGSA